MSFADALAEGTVLAMERDPAVFVMGVGVDDPGGVFGSTRLPHQRFGDARVFDTPISENSLTGVAVGAALTGMRPMLVHARTDFLPLTLDQLANHAAKWSYMAGGALKAPIVVRAVIGRGWGQAAQHSQSLQAIVAHFPGLQVVMPAAPADAKGLLLSALTGDHPVVCLEHRWSYGQTGEVPEGWHPVPIGRARVAREGTHLTFVAASQMVHECLRAVAGARVLPHRGGPRARGAVDPARRERHARRRCGTAAAEALSGPVLTQSRRRGGPRCGRPARETGRCVTCPTRGGFR
jgi:pyruvate dehydrogenase E1 component beta subunit